MNYETVAVERTLANSCYVVLFTFAPILLRGTRLANQYVLYSFFIAYYIVFSCELKNSFKALVYTLCEDNLVPWLRYSFSDISLSVSLFM